MKLIEVVKPILVRNRHGRTFNLLDIQPNDLSIEDLAWALSQVNRSGGQSLHPFSVSSHSVFVACLVPDHLAYKALMHDCVEGTGANDTITQLKTPERVALEDLIHRRLATIFGFTSEPNSIIKAADSRAYAWERYYLSCGELPAGAETRPQESALAEAALEVEIPWQESYKMFMAHYEWALSWGRGVLQ